MSYVEPINLVRQDSDEVLLFHSATGKDSIMLLDLIAKKFDRVTCVFMYIVKGLEYENAYIGWAKKKYKNVEFIQTPHYALNSFIRNGYLGIKKDPKMPKTKISNIDLKMKTKTGIKWSVYGFKKNDGMTRRIMLNQIDKYVDYRTNKAYPLAELTNSDVIKYIADNDLIPPFNYSKKKPSSGCDISQTEFLIYLQNKYQDDLKKICKQFPECAVKLYKYNMINEDKRERNHHYTEEPDYFRPIQPQKER